LVFEFVFAEESRAAAVIPLNERWAIVASFPLLAGARYSAVAR
jgi:hypothetical protein